MSVRIAFTASRTVLGRLIRWFTNGRTSHTFLVYDDLLWSGEWVAEATVGGVRMIPAEKVHSRLVAMYACRFDVKPALREIRQHIGDEYDYSGLVWFGWTVLLWRLFRKKARKPFHTPSAQFCSELVARFLLAAERTGQISTLPGLSKVAEENSPESLLKIIEENPQYFTEVA